MRQLMKQFTPVCCTSFPSDRNISLSTVLSISHSVHLQLEVKGVLWINVRTAVTSSGAVHFICILQGDSNIT